MVTTFGVHLQDRGPWIGSTAGVRPNYETELKECLSDSLEIFRSAALLSVAPMRALLASPELRQPRLIRTLPRSAK